MPTVLMPLTRGKWALIDAADWPLVRPHKWCAQHISGQWYATAWIEGKRWLMHRLLLNEPQGLYVDHIDGDGLNNARSNLRPATNAQNQVNRRGPNRGSTTGILGVSKAPYGRYQVHISAGGKPKYVGTFRTAEEALAARIEAERIHYGEFAPRR